ncbi:MAG: hypothetical protein JNL81_02350 [Hyphomonadaceae bacterium]|nr:hypothetical protein [Hyphomonadaceae bacterium]
MPAGTVPVRESVGAALRFVRENLRFVVTVAAIFAVVSTIISAVTLSVPQVGLLTMVANGILQAFSYAALVGAALYGVGPARGRWPQDGWKVWFSMVVVGFFMCIVVFVITIPASIALVAGPLGRYAADLQAANSDQAAVMAIMLRFVEENPAAVLVTVLFYFVVWLLLTSRLYLAAPASIDAKRTLTFETWNWTKGAMFQISSARLMLLIPAYVLMFALTALIGRVFGFNVLDPASMQTALNSNMFGVILFEFISSFVALVLYVSLEAGLSSYLYKGLKPVDAPAAPAPAV